jgi:hypothetical protein
MNRPIKSFLKIFLSNSNNSSSKTSLSQENKSIIQKFLKVIFQIIEFNKISKFSNNDLINYSIFLPDEFLQNYLTYCEKMISSRISNHSSKYKITKPLELKQNNFNNDIFFSNFKELKIFFFNYVFDYMYFEYIIENKNNSKSLDITSVFNYSISQSDPIEQILSLNLEKFTKNIPLISKEFINTPDHKDSVYKLILPKSDSNFRSEIFSINYIRDNYVHIIDPNKKEINYGNKNNIGEFKKEIAKIIPDDLNFLNMGSNLNILKHVRKNDVLGYNPFCLHINIKKSFRGIRRNQIGLRQAIINLGPGEIEFFSIDHSNSLKLDHLLKEKFNSFLEEQLNTVWFPKIEMLVEHKITINHTILNINEMVVLPLGSLYYYKTRKESVCFLYDFGYKELNQLENLLNVRNSSLSTRKKPFIKFFTLLLDIINRDLNSLNNEILKFSYEKIKEVIYLDHENLKFLENHVTDMKDQVGKFLNRNKPKLKLNLVQEPEEYNAKFCDLCLINQNYFKTKSQLLIF